MKFVIVIIGFSAIALTGCASLQNSGSRAIQNFSNSPAYVKCMSGDVVLYEGKTKTKPESETGSDGYFFQDSEGTVEVSGNCLIRY